MPDDVLWRVRWEAGELFLHGTTSKGAIDSAIEYLRVAEAKRITAERVEEEIDASL